MFIQFLWNLLNDLSFLMILSLISINVPGIANAIQVMMMGMIYLDILQTGKWLN